MRPALLAFFLFLAAALPCSAYGDKPKPNTLTPKEIADGWILLFDGETTFGWGGEGWKVEEGEVVSPGKKMPLRSKSEFAYFDVEFEFKTNEKSEDILGFGKYSERDSHPVRIGLYGNHPGWQRLSLSTSSNETAIAGIIYGLKTKKDPTFPEANIRADAGTPVPLVFTGESLRFRNLKLRPDRTRSLFNGKDLTGWQEFPGKKSKFTVTDGTINVKDGPGDLQTTGKYKDFILQLECKSNGKHLNSGIFFRCRDGEYQNGYEAQIRNQFTEEPTQKYQIEEYDPMTNKLIGKKEILSTAVDYGTGAIYRRMPARKEMAKDGEWFTMTIVAHGNHIATWVNGVQVVDWTDNRPKSDNARTGCKLDAGHISIQGHDPSTDLSFRNIRIAEFK